MTEKELKRETKKELIEMAENLGIEVKSSHTKAKIIEALLASPAAQSMSTNATAEPPAEGKPEVYDPVQAIEDIVADADADAIPDNQRFMWVVRSLAKHLNGAGVNVSPKKEDGSFDFKVSAPIGRTFTVSPKK